MRKTRKINRRRSKTYIKRGGNKNKKNNINMSTLTTQMIGGQTPAAVPAGAPAGPAVNYNLDYASVVRSLRTFGETVANLKEATAIGKQAAFDRVTAANADATAVASLDTATVSLSNAFFGVRSATGQVVTPGLFNTMLPSEVFTRTSSANPSPAPR